MPTELWGTLARDDGESVRRTRGLELGAAVRLYNELAVPGLGGLWFGKPLVWSVFGIELGTRLNRSKVECANAIEALACWLAIHHGDGARDPRVRGRNKLARLPPDPAPVFKAARRRGFYVTAPMRQGMVQPLRALGFVDNRVQRFNAFDLTEAGERFLVAACDGRRPARHDCMPALEEWVKGTGAGARAAKSDVMKEVLSPLVALSVRAVELLREGLLTGDGGARRLSVIRWLRPLSDDSPPVSWATRPSVVASDHWNELREGAHFFLLRDAALAVLDQLEGALRHSAASTLTLSSAVEATEKQLEALHARASQFLSANPKPRVKDAAEFAQQCRLSSSETVLAELARRDGRGVRLNASSIVPGPAFVRVASESGSENESGDVDAEPAKPSLSLPMGIADRVYALHSLDRDMQRVSPVDLEQVTT